MEEARFDVVVIGAGAAGLIAATEVALTGRTVAVIEAKGRSGGRMHTVFSANGFPVELGAEFVHGNLPLTMGLLKKDGVKTFPLRGSFWRHKNGELSEQEAQIADEDDLQRKFGELKQDMPVAQFLSTRLAGEEHEALRLTLTNYVEGYYAADPANASTAALRDELMKDDEPNYRIEGGYQTLVDHLEGRCREKDVRFFFSETVHRLHWRKNEVRVETAKAHYSATKAIITVSVGVLAANTIGFSPAFPEKMEAARRLGFGHVVKVVLVFEDAFWKEEGLTGGKDLSDLNFLFSGETIPTWWTQHPKEEAVLVGWLGGPKAAAFQGSDKAGLLTKALFALGCIFNLDVLHLSQKLVGSHFYNWQTDPAFCGAYSYEVVGGEALQKTVLRPAEGTVYFAGEGLHHGPEIGTVEAALQSGQTVARELIAQA